MDGWCIAATTYCEIAVIAVIARNRRDRKPCKIKKTGE